MKKLLITIIYTTITLATPELLWAAELTGLPEAQSKLPLNRVEKQVTLLESVKDGSALRLGLVVLDTGGSTDVSPKAGLYLTGFSESEMHDAGSLHFLGPIQKLFYAKRVEAGIYDVHVQKLDSNFAEVRTILRLDARALLAALKEQQTGNEDLAYQQITTALALKESVIR